jgi:apolipoprotein N-acyltransferase
VNKDRKQRTENRGQNCLFSVFCFLFSGALLVLAFPPFDLEILAWVALIPLFFAIEGAGPKKAFSLSYLAGAIFFFGTVWWLIHVTLPGMILVVLYLALYFGLFGLVANLVMRGSDRWMLLFVPAAWVAAEYLRSHVLTGFGWVLLGYSQYLTLPVIQIADTTGAWGVSFIIVMMNVGLYKVAKELKAPRPGFSRQTHATIMVLILSLFGVLYYGHLRLKNIFTGEPLRISVIQGNIPQERKWDPQFKGTIMEKYNRLTREAAAQKPDIIIWPETAVPGFLDDDELSDAVTTLAKEIDIPLLVGAPRCDRNGRYYNSAYLFLKRGEEVSLYDKLHLVPFGEYIPCRGVFSFVDKFAPIPIGDFVGGSEYTVFKFGKERSFKEGASVGRFFKAVKFSVLICFEDIFPELVRGFISRGASFLVNITNDAWFLKTAAPYQHAQASVFRAVEARTNVVRAANTGLSCFIDQKGRIVAKVEKAGADTFVEGFKTHEIILSRARTFYIRFGDIFAYAAILLTTLFLLRSFAWHKRDPRNKQPFI